MKVFILLFKHDDKEVVMGVYSTLEAAEAAHKSYLGGCWLHRVQCREVDERPSLLGIQKITF